MSKNLGENLAIGRFSSFYYSSSSAIESASLLHQKAKILFSVLHTFMSFGICISKRISLLHQDHKMVFMINAYGFIKTIGTSESSFLSCFFFQVKKLELLHHNIVHKIMSMCYQRKILADNLLAKINKIMFVIKSQDSRLLSRVYKLHIRMIVYIHSYNRI